MLRGLKFPIAGKRHDSLMPVVTQKNNVDSSTLKFSKALLISNKGLWGVVVVPYLGAMAAYHTGMPWLSVVAIVDVVVVAVVAVVVIVVVVYSLVV